MAVLTDLRNRGVKDTFFVVCDGLKGLAAAALDELEADWGARCPAVIRLGRSAWTEFIPFLDYDVEIRQVICITNAIEALNARYRPAVKARGHFPTEQAALKCLYLVTRSMPRGARPFGQKLGSATRGRRISPGGCTLRRSSSWSAWAWLARPSPGVS
jgi:putative transposase